MIRKKFELIEEESDDWSSYLHEPYRIRRLRRKQIVIAAIAVLLIAAWLLYLFFQVGTDTSIQIFGSGANSTNRVASAPGAIGENATVNQTPPFVSITVNPGYTVAANFTQEQASSEKPTSQDNNQEQDSGRIYWENIVIPLLPIAVILFAGIKIAGLMKSEVNFGVYKGAMPLEMHTTKKKLVFNNELQKTNVFGKDKSEYTLIAEASEFILENDTGLDKTERKI
jgi:hypothetical protein